MPEQVISALVGGTAIIFAAMLGAIVTLAVHARRNSNPGPRCAAYGGVASMKQEIDSFHPRIERAMEELATTEREQSEQLVKIATILEERLPKGGGKS